MLFIFAELGTTGNQDAGGQLILKGKVNNFFHVVFYIIF
mgnify:CR=1 FL=1